MLISLRSCILQINNEWNVNFQAHIFEFITFISVSFSLVEASSVLFTFLNSYQFSAFKHISRSRSNRTEHLYRGAQFVRRACIMRVAAVISFSGVLNPRRSIYIVIIRKTVSLYHTISWWLYMLDASSRDRIWNLIPPCLTLSIIRYVQG